MSILSKASCWTVAVAALCLCVPSIATAGSLTLDSAPGINTFNADSHLISGATVSNGPVQPAAFEAFHWGDAQNDGIWNGPDTQRRSIGTFSNGKFGLYSSTQSLGGFSAAHQYVRTRGILVLDDVMITTSDPSAPSSIQTSLNFHVSGSTSHYNRASQPDVITAELTMAIKVHGNNFRGKYAWSEYKSGPTPSVNGLGTQIAGGGFSEDFNATVTTGPATVPVNTPFTVRMEFVLSAGAGGGSFGSYGGLTFNALGSAGFQPGDAIFNDLPDGYTASNTGGIIVNNAAIPEPTSASLAILGILGLVPFRRRR